MLLKGKWNVPKNDGVFQAPASFTSPPPLGFPTGDRDKDGDDGDGDVSTSSIDPFKVASDLRYSREGERQRSASLTRSYYRRVQKPHCDIQQQHGHHDQQQQQEQQRRGENATTGNLHNSKAMKDMKNVNIVNTPDPTDDDHDRTRSCMSWTMKSPSTSSSKSKSVKAEGSISSRHHDVDHHHDGMKENHSTPAQVSPTNVEHFNRHRHPYHQQHHRSKSLDFGYYNQQSNSQRERQQQKKQQHRGHNPYSPYDVERHPFNERRQDDVTNDDMNEHQEDRFELPSFMSGLTHESDFDNETIKKDNKSSTTKKEKKTMISRNTKMNRHHPQRHIEVLSKRSRRNTPTPRSSFSSQHQGQCDHRMSKKNMGPTDQTKKASRAKQAPAGILRARPAVRKSSPTETIKQTPIVSPDHVTAQLPRKSCTMVSTDRRSVSKSAIRSTSCGRTASQPKETPVAIGGRQLSVAERGRSKEARAQQDAEASTPRPSKRSPREPSPGIKVPAVVTNPKLETDGDKATTTPSPTCGLPFRSFYPSASKDPPLSIVSPEPFGVRLDTIKSIHSNDTIITPVDRLTLSVISKASFTGSFPVHHPANFPSPREEPVGRRLNAEFSEKKVKENPVIDKWETERQDSNVDEPITTVFPPLSPTDDEQSRRYPMPSLPLSRSRSLTRSSRTNGDPGLNGSRPSITSKRSKSLPRRLSSNDSYKSYDWSAKGYTLEDHVVVSYGGKIEWPLPETTHELPEATSEDAFPTTEQARSNPFRDPLDFRGVEIFTQLARASMKCYASAINGTRADSALMLTSMSDMTDESDSNVVSRAAEFIKPVTKSDQYGISSTCDLTQASDEFVPFSHNDSCEFIQTKPASHLKENGEHEQDLKSTITNRPLCRKGNPCQIRLVTQEAVSHSLLSPLDGEESVDEGLTNELYQIDQTREQCRTSDGFQTPLVSIVRPQVQTSTSSRTNVPPEQVAASLSSAQRKLIISNYLTARVVSSQKHSLHRVESSLPHTLNQATMTSEFMGHFHPYSPSTRSPTKYGEYLVFDRPGVATGNKKFPAVSPLSSRTGASSDESLDEPSEWSNSVLTDEKGEVSNRVSVSPVTSTPLAEWMQSLTKDGNSEMNRIEINVEDSLRRILACKKGAKLQSIETRCGRSSSCLESFGLVNFYMMKRTQQSSRGYVNLSLNESVTSSTGIDDRNKSAIPLKSENATAFTPTTFVSTASDSGDGSDEAEPSNKSNKFHDFSNLCHQRLNMEAFSVEQLEI